MKNTVTEPRLYVGTYAKYASGSIAGDWLSLEGHDADSFHAACLELHSDEVDPELMFQDFEGFPRDFYGESHLDGRVWEWVACSESDRELWEAYAEAIGYPIGDTELACAQDAFCGQFDSVEDFAEQTCEDCSDLSGVPDFIRHCIDWRAVWQSALRFDYVEHGGFFFRN